MTTYDYDLIVLGAGSGGVRAGRLAAAMGKKVLVAEESRVGGTCVIRGCVPKKLFVYASHYAHDFADAAAYGWRGASAASFDWQTLRANKDKEIARLEGIYLANLSKAGAELVRARATLAGPHEVVLSDRDTTVSAERILVATGGRPSVPPLPGAERASISDDMFDLEHFPKRAVVVGGGYIAVEFAGILNGLGCQTTLAYRGEQILRGFDEDLRAQLHDELGRAGIEVRLGATPERLEAPDAKPSQQQEGVRVVFAGGKTIDADVALFATGRAPNTRGIGLEEAGVVLDKAGAVQVDAFSQSSVGTIYAIGDVTNRLNLTPVAIREAVAFVDTVYGGKPTPADRLCAPTAVFSQPALGTVGLTEAQARKALGSVAIYKTGFKTLKHTLTGRDTRAFLKLIVDAATDKVVGAHVMCDEAGELIQTLGIAVKLGATKAQFDATMAVHPTTAEELVTMREPVA